MEKTYGIKLQALTSKLRMKILPYMCCWIKTIPSFQFFSSESHGYAAGLWVAIEFWGCKSIKINFHHLTSASCQNHVTIKSIKHHTFKSLKKHLYIIIYVWTDQMKNSETYQSPAWVLDKSITSPMGYTLLFRIVRTMRLQNLQFWKFFKW